MKKSNLIDFCKNNGFTIEEFNSNNGWGFGGAYGTVITKGNITVKEATACYRHLRPEKFITVTIDGYRTKDVFNTPTERNNTIEYLKTLI